VWDRGLLLRNGDIFSDSCEKQALCRSQVGRREARARKEGGEGVRLHTFAGVDISAAYFKCVPNVLLCMM